MSNDARELQLSESQYLAREAVLARRAMGQSLKDAAKELGHGVDPRGWVQEHPWLTLGAAGVAGFVAAALIVPAKGSKRPAIVEHLEEKVEKGVEKLADKLKDKIKGKSDSAKSAPDAPIPDGRAPTQRSGFGWAMVIGAEVLSMARPLIATLLEKLLSPPAPIAPEDAVNPAQTDSSSTAPSAGSVPPTGKS